MVMVSLRNQRLMQPTLHVLDLQEVQKAGSGQVISLDALARRTSEHVLTCSYSPAATVLSNSQLSV